MQADYKKQSSFDTFNMQADFSIQVASSRESSFRFITDQLGGFRK